MSRVLQQLRRRINALHQSNKGGSMELGLLAKAAQRIAELEADDKQAMHDIERMLATISEYEVAQRWIPVSERLPESGETVIAWDTNIEDFCRVIFSREMLSYPEITHWRPYFTSPTPQEQNNGN